MGGFANHRTRPPGEQALSLWQPVPAHREPWGRALLERASGPNRSIGRQSPVLPLEGEACGAEAGSGGTGADPCPEQDERRPGAGSQSSAELGEPRSSGTESFFRWCDVRLAAADVPAVSRKDEPAGSW